MLELVVAAAEAVRESDLPAEALDPLTGELARRVPGLDAPPVQARLTEAAAQLYDRGWQPADVVHVTGRRVSRRAGRLVAAVLVAEAAETRAAGRAPLDWVDQLAGLGTATGLPGWWATTEVDAATAWRDVVRVLALLPTLPRLEQLVPGPAGWPQHQHPAGGAPDRSIPVEEKVLGRVRGLLAKAERTEFPEEADALTAKAQELMSRHAIDAALLADRGAAGGAVDPDVRARRLHLDDPYAEPKAHLLQAVAAANGCRVVLLTDLGIATVVGLPTDLELVELLFTSLLLQATRALAESTRSAATRSAVFRRGFLYSYATRVGERLAEARDRAAADAEHTWGTALVPVLARRDAAVAATVQELFPRLRERRGRTVDAAGWHAGRRAADDADLGPGRRPLRR